MQIGATGEHILAKKRVIVESHPALSRYHFLPATLGELWSELGDKERAAAYYRSALMHVCTEPERRLLQKRLAACQTT